MEFIFATQNQGKLKEIRAIFTEKGHTVHSASDFGIDFNPVETGNTFTDNALEKATGLWYLTEQKKHIILADDSGLCIDALDGQPGVYSARWLGESTPYTQKNQQILTMLKDVPENKRSARFVCVIAAVLPDGKTLTAEAAIEGRIAYEPVGENGFGYDPIFYVPELDLTSAQISPEEKNRISHRGQALRAMLQKLSAL